MLLPGTSRYSNRLCYKGNQQQDSTRVLTDIGFDELKFIACTPVVTVVLHNKQLYRFSLFIEIGSIIVYYLIPVP